MKRAVAALAAVGMVVASLAVRDRIAGDDGGGTSAGGGTVRLACAADLRVACEAAASGDVRVVVDDAGAIADALVAATDGAPTEIDGWLVTAPWVELVADARSRARRAPVLDPPGERLARSPLVLATWKERAAALAPACADVSWKCLGEAAAKGWAAFGHPEWGDVKPAIPRADASATGLAVLGQAATSYFGRAAFDRIDMDEDPGFGGWLASLARSPAPDDALARMLTQGPSASDSVGTTEAEATALLARAARRDDVALTYPAPVATADVVLATAVGRGELVVDAVDVDAIREALSAAGWRVAGRPRSARSPGRDLPAGSGLPPAGVLDDLRGRWRAAR